MRKISETTLEIEPLDVGTTEDGIGEIQARDIGKRGYRQRGGLAWENDAQRNARQLLRYHVTGAIERGEARPIVEVRA